MNQWLGLIIGAAIVLALIIVLMIALRLWMRQRQTEGKRLGVLERIHIGDDA